MATLPRASLPTREQIQDQRLTLEQIRAAETSALRQRDLTRLDNPYLRPQRLERESVILLQAIARRLNGISATSAVEIAPYLDLALLNLHQAIFEAARSYPDMALKPQRAEKTERVSVLPATQIKLLTGLREGTLRLLALTAPVDIALSLLRVTDWLDLAIKATEKQQRLAEWRLLHESSAGEFATHQ